MKKTVLLRLAVLVLLIGGIFVWLFASGAIVLDHSGTWDGNTLLWNGYRYVSCAGEHREGKRIAAAEGNWDIHRIEGDPEHRFVVVRSFLDNYLYRREDTVIPEAGTVTGVYINGFYRDADVLLEQMARIYGGDHPDLAAADTVENLPQDPEASLKGIHICFADCPVGVWQGYIGTYRGRWIITNHGTLTEPTDPTDSQSPSFRYAYWYLPESVSEVLEEYWQ